MAPPSPATPLALQVAALDPTTCPGCGVAGRKVKAITPTSLLTAARDRWDGSPLR